MAKIKIEVAYALPGKQTIIELMVEDGCAIKAAIEQSGILALFPDIDLQRQPVGVFSKPRMLADVVKPGERIEIYRPLTIDAKAERRRRVKRKKQK